MYVCMYSDVTLVEINSTAKSFPLVTNAFVIIVRDTLEEALRVREKINTTSWPKSYPSLNNTCQTCRFDLQNWLARSV